MSNRRWNFLTDWGVKQGEVTFLTGMREESEWSIEDAPAWLRATAAAATVTDVGTGLFHEGVTDTLFGAVLALSRAALTLAHTLDRVLLKLLSLVLAVPVPLPMPLAVPLHTPLPVTDAVVSVDLLVVPPGDIVPPPPVRGDSLLFNMW